MKAPRSVLSGHLWLIRHRRLAEVPPLPLTNVSSYGVRGHARQE